MGSREIVDAYLEGRINSWGVFRRLVQLGVTTATALAVAGAFPTVVRSQDLRALVEVAQTAEETRILNELVAHLASQLERVGAGGPIRPLAATLALIGVNNGNLIECDTCPPIPLSVNDGNVNLIGELSAEEQRAGPLNLNLNGNIGQSNVSLVGVIELPDDVSSGVNVNLGAVNLSFNGNVGDASLNFFGNVGGLLNTESR